MIVTRLRQISLLLIAMAISALAFIQMFQRTADEFPMQYAGMLALAVVLFLVLWGLIVRFQPYASQSILPCVLLLTATGVTMIARIDQSEGWAVAQRQLIWLCIAIVLSALLIIFLNIRNVPGMFASIFHNAFDLQSVMGGFSGRMGTSTVTVTSLVTSSVKACPAGSAASGAGTSGWFSSAAADGARQSRAPSASESANILHFIALSPFHKNSYYYNMHGGDGMQALPSFFGGVNKNRKNSLGKIANFELRVCCKITKRNLTRPEWPAGRLPGWQWA